MTGAGIGVDTVEPAPAIANAYDDAGGNPGVGGLDAGGASRACARPTRADQDGGVPVRR
jgi:hypothetical protein